MKISRTAIITVACVAAFGAIAALSYGFIEESFRFNPEPAHKDGLESNANASSGQFDLSFIDWHGDRCEIADYRGAKNVMLVFMRGYPGEVCINCSAQTSRLIRNHREFADRETEILLIFPGPKDHLDKFLAAGRAKAGNEEIPFRVLLDTDFLAVDKLGIRGSLAKPSTYILDKQGQVRFAYVGAYTGDRPSIKSMLDQIDRIRSSGGQP